MSTLHSQSRESFASQSQTKQVVKRDGRREDAVMDKITKRIEGLCYGLDRDFVDPGKIAKKVVEEIPNGISTVKLDEFTAKYVLTLAVVHPDFAVLTGRIAVSNLQKQTDSNFSDAMKTLFENIEPVTKSPKPLIDADFYKIVEKNKGRLNAAICHNRDFDYSYFGFRTLERACLMKVAEKIVERPQFMIMRVALGIHKTDIDSAIETYNLMSKHWFTHATPTLSNAGRLQPQLSSCFLLTAGDSFPDAIATWERGRLISKHGGDVNLSLHSIRHVETGIDTNLGEATGLSPLFKACNDLARSVNQGGRHFGGSAVYLEPWHPHISEFVELFSDVDLKKQRCPDLSLVLWIPDLFMKCVDADGPWYLMSPDKCPGLTDSWGKKFEALYQKYVKDVKYSGQVKARDLWHAIISSQCKTGLPYILYKDACNRKSNQQNLGTINCSNLCTEVVQYSSKDEVAVCNLASIALDRFIRDDGRFDFEQLRHVSGVVTKNLNKVIDVNYYPVKEAQTSNMRHRPIGIGVQGLADVFMIMRLSFTSPEARKLNKKIFETIYYGALSASCELAEKFGKYGNYEGSPISKGEFQFDMWENATVSKLWDWQGLRDRIAKFGIRNSLLIALTSTDSFEPKPSNVSTYRVGKQVFHTFNPHLVRDLIKLKLWGNKKTRDHLIQSGGSVQSLEGLEDFGDLESLEGLEGFGDFGDLESLEGLEGFGDLGDLGDLEGLEGLPKELEEVKAIYSTAWELDQLELIEMAADRGAFVDQSQSLNLFVESPNYDNCTELHFRAWESGLKTGMYYLRPKPSVDSVKLPVKRRLTDGFSNEGAKTNEEGTPQQ